MLSDWLSIGYNIAVFGAWAVILCASMQERFSRRTTILLYVLASPLYFLLPQFVLPYGSLSRALVGMLSFTILQLFLYREKWYKTLFIVLVLIGVMMLSELLTVAFFTSAEALQTSVEMNSQPGFHIVNYLFCAVIHGLFLWLFALFLRRYRMRICPSEWLLYVAFPFSQCLLLLGWMDVSRANLDGSRLALMLAAVVICVVADTAMFAAIRGMTQRSELRSKNALLETQIASQKEHYSSITAQYQEIRRIRHDIASHLYTMEILLQQGKYREAAAYSQEVKTATRYTSQMGNCENPILDAYLFSRRAEIQQQGIEMTVHTTLPETCGVSDTDLIIAMGNLLDNAVEACKDGPSPQLRVRVQWKKGYVVIESDNTIHNEIQVKKRRIPELERGIGHHILQELAEKYQGTFTHENAGSWFHAQLIMRGDAAHASHCHL